MTGSVRRKGLTVISVLASTRRESSDISVTCFPAFLCAGAEFAEILHKVLQASMLARDHPM